MQRKSLFVAIVLKNTLYDNWHLQKFDIYLIVHAVNAKNSLQCLQELLKQIAK